MKLYLTRRANGDYILTRLRPVVAMVRGAGTRDAYLQPGEPIGVMHLCPRGVTSLFGVELEPLESRKVSLFAEVEDA